MSRISYLPEVLTLNGKVVNSGDFGVARSGNIEHRILLVYVREPLIVHSVVFAACKTTKAILFFILTGTVRWKATLSEKFPWW